MSDETDSTQDEGWRRNRRPGRLDEHRRAPDTCAEDGAPRSGAAPASPRTRDAIPRRAPDTRAEDGAPHSGAAPASPRTRGIPVRNDRSAAHPATASGDKNDTAKKILLLLLSAVGFTVFLILGISMAASRRTGRSGTLPDGRHVRYAGVSPSETADGGTKATLAQPPKSDRTFVRVTDYAPSIRVDLRYAGKRNLAGKRIYSFRDAYLRYGTVKKLIRAQKQLEKNGMGLLIWDAYRPHEAQKTLWEICPNPLYVKNPSKGCSDHTRGSAVDVTLVDADGTELVMPTGFDNLTRLADRDYSDIEDDFARDNARMLEKAMKSCGFEAYSEEWWHFTDSDKYDVARDFKPES